MDWVRRNFPDILIGVALILVVAAIVVTLLNGGSFFPRGRQVSDAPGITPNLTTPTNSNNPVVATTPNTTPPPSISASPNTSDTTEANPLINPIPPITSDTSTTSVDTSETTDVNDTGISVVPPSTTTTTATPNPTVTTTTTSTTTSNNDLPTEPYRIGVGAFRSRENAERLANEVRAEGYPVFIGSQDDLNLVLVGPYMTESEAAQVATRLRNSGRDVTIYEFRPGDETQTVSTSTNSTSTGVSTSSSGSFIQVGAYGSVDSSLPQQQRLEALGFSVQTVQSGSLYRLLIGPYAGEAIDQVQAQLTREGIDHFVTSGP